jgi:hypothetical protein
MLGGAFRLKVYNLQTPALTPSTYDVKNLKIPQKSGVKAK